jgi:hypothetical protein
MKLLRALFPLKATASGLAFVKTSTFANQCQRIAIEMLKAGKTWEDIDGSLRCHTIAALLPKRNYSEDEAMDFLRNNFQLVDRIWLPLVLQMKRDYVRMTEDPAGFLKELGILPSSPLFGQQVASAINGALPPKR